MLNTKRHTTTNAIRSVHSSVLRSQVQLREILINSRKQVYTNAVALYWHLRSYYRPIKGIKKGGGRFSMDRMHTDGLHLDRARLAEELKCSKRTISKALDILERFGLIVRNYETKGKSVNHLVIYLLKNTPHFYNEFGVSDDQIPELNPHTNHGYIDEKFSIKFSNKTIGLKRENSAIGYCNGDSTDNTGEGNISQDIFPSSSVNNKPCKNNFYVVKNSETSQQKRAQQKSSLSDDFVATTETLERDWELDYSNTALPKPPEYVLADSGLAKGEFDYGHCPPEPTESVDTYLASDFVLGDTTPNKSIPKQEKAKEDTPMAKQQTKLEPRQELNCQILKNFSTTTAAELQQKLDIKPIAPNKLGLVFKQGLELNADEKERLRQTLKLVYGDSVQLVIKKPTKPKMATKEDTEKRSEPKALTPAETKWEAVKNDVLDVIYQNQREYYQSYFARAEVIRLDGRKLKLQARWDVCEKMKDKQTTIELIAAKHDVDIEVKNITDHDILYLPFIKPNLDFLEK